jgi:DNA polymerase-3 subunit beta
LTGTDLEVEMVSRTGRRCRGRRNHDSRAQAVRDLRACRTAGITGQPATRSPCRPGAAVSPGHLAGERIPVGRRDGSVERVALPEAGLKELIERTAFAMAHQDVRYYLNGCCSICATRPALRGHRRPPSRPVRSRAGRQGRRKRQIIVPRKGVTELQRLLEGGDRELELEVGAATCASSATT